LKALYKHLQGRAYQLLLAFPFVSPVTGKLVKLKFTG
jgi:hypothetical protein